MRLNKGVGGGGGQIKRCRGHQHLTSRCTLECLLGSLVAVELTWQRSFWVLGFFDDSDLDATLNREHDVIQTFFLSIIFPKGIKSNRADQKRVKQEQTVF